MEYRERYKEFTRNARRIERHFQKISDAKKCKLEAQKAAGKEPVSSSDDDEIPAVTSNVEIDMEEMMDTVDNMQNDASKNVDDSNVQNSVTTEGGKGGDANVKNVSAIAGENQQPSSVETDATKPEIPKKDRVTGNEQAASACASEH